MLVTGGAGFIGSNVVDALVSKGTSVAIVDNLSTGRRQHLNPQARFYHLDIQAAELSRVFERERPQAVVHLAAQASVPVSVEDPLRDATVNVLGSLNLLEQCRRFDVKRLVYSSSGGAVYGEPQHLPCGEDHPVRPLSPYGASKYAVELYLHAYVATAGLQFTILRFANVYGPRQDPYGEAGVVAIFSKRMLDNQPVTIYGTGEQQRDFVYVDDVVAAVLLGLEHTHPGVYNLGCGKGVSVNEVFRALAEITSYMLPPRFAPPRPGDVFKSFLDCTRIERELRWRPQVELREGLRRTVDYLRGQPASAH
ncbi:MAG: NAD-dependent epimerase/dehydratase family protein [Chloroflexi bacterium]|nr:NAD-dependent epimerase/dehydratase family protein [Chloroflexota bacterium]